MTKFFWYHICNDYSLEPCSEPKEEELFSFSTCSEGTVYFNQYDEAIYLCATKETTEWDESEYAE